MDYSSVQVIDNVRLLSQYAILFFSTISIITFLALLYSILTSMASVKFSGMCARIQIFNLCMMGIFWFIHLSVTL